MLRITQYLLALLYDLFLLLCLWIVMSIPVVIALKGHAVAAGSLWYRIYLIMIALGYLLLCSYRQGKTVGMKAWHL